MKAAVVVAAMALAVPVGAQQSVVGDGNKAQEQRNKEPGQSFRDCADCPEMVVIAAGDFIMGSDATEPGRSDREGPQRRVSVRQFAAGKFDVTRAQ